MMLVGGDSRLMRVLLIVAMAASLVYHVSNAFRSTPTMYKLHVSHAILMSSFLVLHVVATVDCQTTPTAWRIVDILTGTVLSAYWLATAVSYLAGLL
jgi:hypothetical protein